MFFTLYFAVYVNICLFNILCMTLNIVEWMTEWQVQRGQNLLNRTSRHQQGRTGGSEPNPLRHTSRAFPPFRWSCWMLHMLRRKRGGGFVKLCRGKKTEKKENGRLVTTGRKVRGGRLPVSLEHEPRYSGGTRTLEARISLKCSHIKAHRLS